MISERSLDVIRSYISLEELYALAFSYYIPITIFWFHVSKLRLRHIAPRFRYYESWSTVPDKETFIFRSFCTTPQLSFHISSSMPHFLLYSNMYNSHQFQRLCFLLYAQISRIAKQVAKKVFSGVVGDC